MAGWLNIEPGTYNQISDSLHIYEHDKRHFLNLNTNKAEDNTDSLCRPKAESELLFSDIFQRMKSMIKSNLSRTDFYNLAFLDPNEPAFQNMLFVIASDSARRKGWRDMAKEFIDKCTNKVYKQLWTGWVNRKSEKAASVCV